jgi:dGTPase
MAAPIRMNVGTTASTTLRKFADGYDDDERERFYPDKTRGDDHRSPFERDRARIIHSAAFRRLQGKTQVFGFGGSDFFRTRLTHSLEVAQIGKGIALKTGFADLDLVEAICLAHDIGHPPFGHTGEAQLHELMKESGGFEANAQNLRVLTKLEVKSSDYDGLNLTRATLDGVLKYKVPFCNTEIDETKFCYNEDIDLVQKISQGNMEKTFECQIMDWADEIAYSVHDLEDGIKAGMITTNILEDHVFRKKVENSLMVLSPQTFRNDWEFIERKISEALTPPGKQEHEKRRKAQRKALVAGLIDYFINETKAKEEGSIDHSRYEHSLDVPEHKRNECALLKAIVWQAIISDEKIATVERKACSIIRGLFEELRDQTKNDALSMFPADFRERLSTDLSKAEWYRVTCDYIAGMTDTYAMKVYSRLKQPELSSIFEIL